MTRAIWISTVVVLLASSRGLASEDAAQFEQLTPPTQPLSPDRMPLLWHAPIVPHGGAPRGGDALPCPPDSLASHRPRLSENFLASLSESGPAVRRFDEFSGVTGPITAMTWWGFELDFVPPNQFIVCEEPDPTFTIAFHEDHGDAPGPVLCEYTRTAVRTGTGFFFGSEDNPVELIQFNATLDAPCILTRGWISIVGHGDGQCWFYWMSSIDGNGSGYCDNCADPATPDLAFCLQGTSGGVFGACCDEAGATCVDAVEMDDCAAEFNRFTPNQSCDAISPPCGQLKGACCFDDGRPCRNFARYFCDLTGGHWLGPDTTCDACPAVGACCQGTTVCALMVEAPCVDEGHTWLAPDTVCADCPALPACSEENTLFGQTPPDPLDEPSASTSELNPGFQVFDTISGLGGAIESVTWWGLDLRRVGNAWVECDEPSLDFSISFHADAGGQPGDTICGWGVTATRTPLDLHYNGARLNEYHAVLPAPCIVTRGWISIRGFGDPNCWFLWMTSNQGDDVAFCQGCTVGPQSADYAFCLHGETGGVFGACCDDATGECLDEKLEITQCLAPTQRFLPNATCDAMNPPCGVVLGACCISVFECSIETAAACQTMGGNWIGPGTACSQCPCSAACPNGGVAENEAACGPGFMNLNGGCDIEPAGFTPIAIGDIVCGRSGFYEQGGNVRFDEDWYELNTNGPADVLWEVVAESPIEIWMVDGTEGCPGTPMDTNFGPPCQPVSLFTFADGPRTYWLGVRATGTGDASSCPARYTATVPFPFGCAPGDVNVDGHRDAVDVQGFTDCVLTGATPTGNCQCADMDGQNGATVDDVSAFVGVLLNQ